MTERFAIYFAPAPASDLRRLAVRWLGRDEVSGDTVEADVPGIDSAQRHKVTTSARRYGFHGTLKAPIALAAGRSRSELEQAVAAFVETHAPLPIGRIMLKAIGGFLALVPEVQSPELSAFAGECVTGFDRFRAPPTTSEREKRFASGLTARQIELLDAYGYPYVLEQAQFHMTIADQMGEADLAITMAAARDWFAPVIGSEIMLDRIALFHEPEPGAPFVRVADFPLNRQVMP